MSSTDQQPYSTDFRASPTDFAVSDFVIINNNTFVRHNINYDIHISFECVSWTVLQKDEETLIRCLDAQNNCVIFSLDTLGIIIDDVVIVDDVIKNRCKTLKQGDTVFTIQEKCTCPVIGCKLTTKHIANEECVLVTIKNKSVIISPPQSPFSELNPSIKESPKSISSNQSSPDRLAHYNSKAFNTIRHKQINDNWISNDIEFSEEPPIWYNQPSPNQRQYPKSNYSPRQHFRHHGRYRGNKPRQYEHSFFENGGNHRMDVIFSK